MYTRPMFIKLWCAFLKTKKKMISSVMSQRTILRAQSLLAERLFSATGISDGKFDPFQNGLLCTKTNRDRLKKGWEKNTFQARELFGSLRDACQD